MNIIGRNYMRITSKNERVYLNSVNKVTFINNKRERERERGGGRRKWIFKQEKQLLFKMSAGTNSRRNANKILGQSQYLSNYTPTPPLTTNSQLMTSQVNFGLEKG